MTQTIYLLDANVLINAHNKYYPVDMVPEFWDWLIHAGEYGLIKMPIETFEEVRGGQEDLLTKWMKKPEVEKALILNESPDISAVRYILDAGYAPDLTDTEIEQVGRDPFLVAYGVIDPENRVVVTEEVSKPSKKRANRKVPDVCVDVGVSHCNTFLLLRKLGFTTGWNR
ncbi:DUF4411 family protein [Pseudomonas sp. BN414]|uniref:DUF4411 family protein n=1 Tax=Pseudomonas sp. BN414 TaxID=2567888 RepID=UPI002457B202|nr:DUF4411 family protein [Pseudomonas sp. BN414]MDH4566151.1 DUF4411 family protein [Pseudomonas sp. BN414]